MLPIEVNQAWANHIELLKKNGTITLPRVEDAAKTVPRHLLLDGLVHPVDAYKDKTVILKTDRDGSVLGKGAVISSATMPGLVLSMIDFLGIEPSMTVLDIGTGSGYSAAVISEIIQDQKKVYSVEIDKEVAENANASLRKAGYGDIHVACANAMEVYSAGKPFDAIFASVGCYEIPEKWLEQIKDGGSILLPCSFSRRAGTYPVIKFNRRQNKLIGRTRIGLCSVGFIPMYGANQENMLVNDEGISKFENDVADVWLQRSYSREILNALLLMLILRLAVITQDESDVGLDFRNFEKEAMKIEAEWTSLGKPKIDDFHFILQHENELPPTYNWLFRRKDRNLLASLGGDEPEFV